MHRHAPLICIASVLASCAPTVAGVREYVVAQYACPSPRVNVQPAGMRPSEFILAQQEDPPDEVARDRDRLALWRDNRRRSAEARDSYETLFDAVTCGEHMVLACSIGHHGGTTCARLDISPRDGHALNSSSSGGSN